MGKLSRKQCADILADEKHATAYYADLGFPKQAADEAKHYRFFKKQCVGKSKR